MSGIHLHTPREREPALLQVARRLLQMVVGIPRLEKGVRMRWEDPELALLG